MSKLKRICMGTLLYIGLLFSFSGCGTDHVENKIESTISSSCEELPDISKEVVKEQCEVIYSFDNSKMNLKLQEGIFSEDLNRDGEEDSLLVEIGEQEGSFFVDKLELNISGVENPYLIENEDCLFLDVFSGNFDEDADVEILLLFDMKYAGAYGRLGLQLLDFNGNEYVNVCDGFFSGYSYKVSVKTGEKGVYSISRENGSKLEINVDNVSESALGKVTGVYYIDIIICDDINRIKIKQYVAGEDMMNHIGDIISEFQLEKGKLIIQNETVVTY